MPATEMIEMEAPILSAPERSPSRHDHGAALAREIGATGHAVFTLTQGPRGRQLACVLQSDFPALSMAGVGRLANCIRGSIRPFWWAQDVTHGFEGLRWASRLEGCHPGPCGVGFPVCTGRGSLGVVIFTGPHLSLPERNLPDLHRRCFDLFATIAAAAVGRPLRETPSLAKRELECIRLAADGLTSDGIAVALGLSLHTANQYLAEAARKLNANGRMHAVAKALRLGLID